MYRPAPISRAAVDVYPYHRPTHDEAGAAENTGSERIALAQVRGVGGIWAAGCTVGAVCLRKELYLASRIERTLSCTVGEVGAPRLAARFAAHATHATRISNRRNQHKKWSFDFVNSIQADSFFQTVSNQPQKKKK